MIENHKNAYRDRLVALCGAAGARQPESLADELFLLLEGARVCSQSVGPKGPAGKLAQLGEAMIAAHVKVRT